MNELNKFFKLCGIFGAVVLCYLVMMPLWPVVYGAAFTSANTINGTAAAYNFRHTIGALRFAPLGLYMIPAAIGVIAFYLVLRKKNGEE